MNAASLLQAGREKLEASRSAVDLCNRYPSAPIRYSQEVLGASFWSKQQDIARLLLTPPYRVLVKSAHNVGKSFLAACLTSWWYDTFNPGVAITTAPTARDVRDILWTEIRILRNKAGLGGFTGNRAPELRSSDDHFAKGFTANTGESFQGRHRERMLFIFDEAVGVDHVFWQTTESMFKPDGKHAWLCLFNPTDSSSEAYQQEAKGGWHVVTMSGLDHPNIADELAGRSPRIPSAISLAQLDGWISKWCQPVTLEVKQASDIEWPPGSQKWWRPGPLAECRALGRWPSQSEGVWSDSLWSYAETLEVPNEWAVPEIGCDVARFGDDFTVFHVRAGRRSLHHERYNGWSTSQTAGRLKRLCEEWAHWFNTVHLVKNAEPLKPTEILCKVDVDGLGGGVVDQADGYSFVAVSSAAQARDLADFPNVRSELWFNSVWLANESRMSVAALPRDVQLLLRRQAMAPTWKVDQAGRVVVERKEETKKRLGMSPDDMDGLNLAYWPAGTFSRPKPIDNPRGKLSQWGRNDEREDDDG